MAMKFAVLIAATAFSLSAPGIAQEEVLDGITRTMKNAERELCKTIPSRKCPKKATTKAAKPESEVDRKTAQASEIAGQTVPKPVLRSDAIEARAKLDSDEQTQQSTEKPVQQKKKADSQQTATPARKEKILPPIDSVTVAESKIIQEKLESRKPASADKPKPAQSGSKANEKQVAHASQAVTAEKPSKPKPLPKGAAECLKALVSEGASFAPAVVEVSDTRCAIDNPVRLSAVGQGEGKVALPGQPTLACTFALKLARWVKEDANPVIRKENGSELSRFETGPGHQCRGRNGDSSAKMSEHASGNAVDIASFRLSNGKVFKVSNALDPAAEGFQTLAKLRQSACEHFTTVLGPGSNSAHEEHFHFDLAERKGGYRICQ